jgi:hypothetical protein
MSGVWSARRLVRDEPGQIGGSHTNHGDHDKEFGLNLNSKGKPLAKCK